VQGAYMLMPVKIYFFKPASLKWNPAKQITVVDGCHSNVDIRCLTCADIFNLTLTNPHGFLFIFVKKQYRTHSPFNIYPNHMKKLFLILLTCLSSYVLQAQTDLKRPEASQAAMVMQRIGLTDITIHYHSPLMKGRKIWGDIVPYDKVWRAGANENTTISFTDDVKVNGRLLTAGTYGLHMIPTEKDWTIIFNKNAGAWGSFFYEEKEDALRITVTPKSAPDQNWLSYVFTDLQPRSVIAELHWEKMAVPFKIEVDVPEVVMKSIRQELTSINGFFWQGFNQAANYCIQENIHLDEASRWVEKSISLQKNFANMNTKAKLLEKQGKADEAASLRKEAVSIADEAQLNTYGYQLMGEGKSKEATEIFQLNVKRYPDSWNVYDSLGEALLNAGDKKGASSNYKTALAKAPDNQKQRIEDILKKL